MLSSLVSLSPSLPSPNRNSISPAAPNSPSTLTCPTSLSPPRSPAIYNRPRISRFHARFPDQETAHVSRPNAAASNNSGFGTTFLSLLCPLLKLFSSGDPSRERNYSLEIMTSSLSTLARLPWGSRSLRNSHDQISTTLDPPISLQLFEFEACPFCRRVREAMTELDLCAEVFPCPKGSVKHREVVRRIGGKEQFPFLVDANSGVSLYESSEIVKYLFQKYGKGRSPSVGLLESTLFTGWMPTIFRAGRGMTLWEKANPNPPNEKLKLFSYENNPYARIVREALCELELPYILLNVGERSNRSKLLLQASGSKEVPYIIDPNTGTHLGDCKKIISYLFRTYSTTSV